MDAELKAKWVEALRSGRYEQDSGSLISRVGRRSSFCCLGVLCDTQGTQWGEIGDAGLLDGIEVRDAGRSYLSPFALARFGLDESQQQKLAGMNDAGRSFDEIADYIEANL
ncbi:hypothetical protein JQ628_11530 [Bradyrhizobium lablabi]|uniref:hypothetical protein n=1 Tax=Bradyrhizobium lablabi TaxID=722472 RepID=UPI001BA4CFB0|nr:hypothetical protein [Bradyrhizobium lablabi]MBR1122147.1 hypothetical protein [Bradyrhizobium lablabi]